MQRHVPPSDGQSAAVVCSESSRSEGDDGGVACNRTWAIVVAAAKAKPVKDELKARGWLHSELKPRTLADRPQCLAFPLVASHVEACRTAVRDRSIPQLDPVLAVESVDSSFDQRKKPPQQKVPPKHGQGRTSLPRTAPKAKVQERSFGGGAAASLLRSHDGGTALPPAEPVQVVECPPDADAVRPDRQPVAPCGERDPS